MTTTNMSVSRSGAPTHSLSSVVASSVASAYGWAAPAGANAMGHAQKRFAMARTGIDGWPLAPRIRTSG